MKRSEK
jgi:hypothetical protein